MEIISGVIAGVNAACMLWGVWLIVTGASRLKRREAEENTTMERTDSSNAVRRLQRRVFGGMLLNVVSLAGWLYLLAAFN